MNHHHNHHNNDVAIGKKYYSNSTYNNSNGEEQDVNNNNNHSNGKNTTMCRFFKSGKCLSGKNCKFSHDLSMINDSDHGNGGNTVPVCKYYLAGYCKSGSKCVYQHIDNDTKITKSTLTTVTPTPTNSPSITAPSIAANTIATNNTTTNTTTTPPTILTTPTNSTSPSKLNENVPTTTAIPSTFNQSFNNSLNNIYNNNSFMNSNGHTNFMPIINGFGPTPTLPILEQFNNNNNNNSIPNLISKITPQQQLFVDENNSIQNSFKELKINNSNNIYNNSNHVDITTPPPSNSLNIQPISKSPLLQQPQMPQNIGSIALSPTRNLQFTNSLSFLPNSPRNTLSSSPSSPFSPQFVHNTASILSSSPSPFFSAPIPAVGFSHHQIGGEGGSTMVLLDHDQYLDDEEEDDEDDDAYNNTNGLIIIDDNYDVDKFDPFEYREIDVKNYLKHSKEILIKQQNDINSNNNNINNSIVTKEKEIEIVNYNNSDSENNEDNGKEPLSYLDALKRNLPADYYISYENAQGPSGNGHGGGNNGNGNGGKGFDRSEILCHFFIQGGCRNGDSCKYVHGEYCEVCEKPMLVPNNAEQNESHITECLISQKKQADREQMVHLECGICFDSIVDKGRRFGLLSHCNHVFCLECIREWRGTNNTTTITAPTTSNSVRLCPMCRTNSHFIIPADIFVSDEKKQQIIEIYKSKLSSIPCKYFNKGKGTCKFGTSCMYAHISDGVPQKPNIRKVQASYGDVTLYSNQLGMFLPNENDNDEEEEVYNDEEEYEEEEEENNYHHKEGYQIGVVEDD